MNEDRRTRRLREQAERLWESIGGELCICQRADVWHWCEKCQQRLQLIEEAIRAAVLDAEGDQPTPPQDRVTRLEVIGPKGRLFTKWNCGVQLSYQDGGRTLKVFVDWAALPDPPVQP